MASTFTPNIQLEEPARGDDVGTWDTPVNSNMTLVDLVVGGIATIPLNNSPVVLSAAQFKARQITFNSTLTGSVVITFPTSFTKSYEIQNLCTGSSAFTITLQTTTAGGLAICCPPQDIIDCVNDGASFKFKNLDRIGAYWDYAGSSVPNWVSGCTVQPYLNCDGTAYNTANYPALLSILGSSILPDIRGVSRATLNQGTGRITTAGSGIDGNTRFSIGGGQTVTIAMGNLPATPAPVTATLTAGGLPAVTPNNASGFATVNAGSALSIYTTPVFAPLSMGANTANLGSGTALNNMPPTTISGICMIRAG